MLWWCCWRVYDRDSRYFVISWPSRPKERERELCRYLLSMQRLLTLRCALLSVVVLLPTAEHQVQQNFGMQQRSENFCHSTAVPQYRAPEYEHSLSTTGYSVCHDIRSTKYILYSSTHTSGQVPVEVGVASFWTSTSASLLYFTGTSTTMSTSIIFLLSP